MERQGLLYLGLREFGGIQGEEEKKPGRETHKCVIYMTRERGGKAILRCFAVYLGFSLTCFKKAQ